MQMAKKKMLNIYLQKKKMCKKSVNIDLRKFHDLPNSTLPKKPIRLSCVLICPQGNSNFLFTFLQNEKRMFDITLYCYIVQVPETPQEALKLSMSGASLLSGTIFVRGEFRLQDCPLRELQLYMISPSCLVREPWEIRFIHQRKNTHCMIKGGRRY